MPSQNVPPRRGVINVDGTYCDCGACREDDIMAQDIELAEATRVPRWRCEDCYEIMSVAPAWSDNYDRPFCVQCTAACDRCDRVRSRRTLRRTFNTDQSLCRNCLEVIGAASCFSCGHVFVGDDRHDTLIQAEDSAGVYACSDCRERGYVNWDQCPQCDDYYRYGLMHSGGCADCGPNPDDECGCEECTYGDQEDGTIHGYGFKPRPQFHGTGRVFLGLELEVETPYRGKNKLAGIADGQLSGLGYLKDDSSISNGFELVTHPMTPDYAAESFPWEMLTELESHGCEADESCGIHVHVNRDGFDGAPHVFKWLRLIYRNASHVQRIARRESNRWASFTGYSTYTDDCKRFAKGSRSGERYVAVNVNNEHTFEVRAFASSLNPVEVRAALELVSGSVEYARQLSVFDIVNDGGWNWDSFMGWAESQDGKYAALVAQNREQI